MICLFLYKQINFMNKNTISVMVYLKDNSSNEPLVNSNPKNAIQDYFFPDSGAPVLNVIIKAMTQDGKLITLSITDSLIDGHIE